MKLSPIYGISFQCHVQRPLKANIQSGSKNYNPATRQDMEDYYDAKINNEMRKKREFLELDDFMFGDEIKRKLNLLPKKDVIKITKHGYMDDSIRLIYSTEDAGRIRSINANQKKETDGEYSNTLKAFDDKGNLDKEGIKKWLDSITRAVFHIR